jgi:glucokinase
MRSHDRRFRAQSLLRFKRVRRPFRDFHPSAPLGPRLATTGSGSPVASLLFAVDLGATKCAHALIDAASGSIVAKRLTSTVLDQTPARFVAAAKVTLTSMLAERGAALESVLAVGMAASGPVDDDGNLLEAGKLEGWTNIPLAADLARAFGRPTFVEQDANAAAIGEAWRGCARRETDFVFLALGSGVGAGIVAGGQLVRGAHCAAGELGDLVVERGRLGSGPRGEHDIDGAIGGWQLRDRASAVLGETVSATDALTRAQSDPRLSAFRDHAVESIALSIIALAAVLDPALVVLGGGISAASDALLNPLRARLAGELPRETSIVCSALGTDAQLFGAARGAAAQSIEWPS